MAITKTQVESVVLAGDLLLREVGNLNSLARRVNNLMEHRASGQIDMSDAQVNQIMTEYAEIKTMLANIFATLP